MSLFTIYHATKPADLVAVSSMFEDYTRWLDMDLTFQGFASELASLPGLYVAPRGALLLARSTESGEALGCIALKPLPLRRGFHEQRVSPTATLHDEIGDTTGSCEVKRLYVSPAARGKGVARALLREALVIATQEGYDKVFLDTLPKMSSAQALYRSEGFVETDRYYENPYEETVYMMKELQLQHTSSVASQ